MKQLVLIVFLILFFPFISYAYVPFGGIVIGQLPCTKPVPGFLLLIKTPSTIVVPYLWAVGNLRFLSYIPPHIGQHILGMALPTPVPCIAGIIPMGVGLPIIYHGSSI